MPYNCYLNHGPDCWVTRNYEHIRVDDLTDEHIANILLEYYTRGAHQGYPIMELVLNEPKKRKKGKPVDFIRLFFPDFKLPKHQ